MRLAVRGRSGRSASHGTRIKLWRGDKDTTLRLDAVDQFGLERW
jgi:hypothetical protein